MMIGVWEIVAIVLVIVLFVGGKKIPDVGKGVRSFKEGLNGIEDDVNRSGEKKKEGKDGSSSAE